MTELFKGYVLTKDKKCIEKYKNRRQFKTYNQVKNLPEFAGILNTGIILIDIDDYEQSEILMDIVEDLQLRCRVYETSRGKHFLFKNTEVETCKTHTKLAVGLTSDIKLGNRNSYSILKYNDKERPIIYDIYADEDYEELPKWLLPIKTNQEFLDMDVGDGRNQALFNYILTLQSNGYTPEEAKDCIRLINKYIMKDSLTDSELETILRDEAFQKPVFFKGKQFLFDKFANYLISQLHIVKINGQLHMYKDGVYIEGYNQIEAQMIKFIPGLNRQKRSEVLAYIEIAVMTNAVVSPANYIAFKDGIYDMERDRFMDFDPSIIITNKINFNYNPHAYSEIVDHTFDKLACHDNEVRQLLEEVAGYTFYRRNELRKAFIAIGDKANGKSTYLDMIKTLLGDENTAALDLKELGDRFKTAELFGKLANIGDDIGDNFIAEPSVFKKLCSGDRVNVERKGRDPFDFNNYSKLLFSANNIPRIKDKSGAVIDRLIIVPFDARFSKDDPDFDPYIKYKLRTDEAMEYLIQLGINGLKRVLSNRCFTTSERVVKQIKEYEESNNPILLFFRDIEESGTSIENEPTKEIYRKYSEFCLANNFTPMSNIEFSKQVKKHYDFEIVNKTIKGKKYRIFIRKEN